MNIERKYFKNMQKTQFLKLKNSLLELGNNFIELKDRGLNDGEVKIKRETEEVFLKLIVLSIDDMDKFERKNVRKIRLFKNTWYDWLINYIPQSIRKSVGGFKDYCNSF